ncbi:KPN_02809 family neutral zinc metallopeptidase [Comamonas suwonensis]|uniref:Neutral zinc metallopeptidase n=1 Tax=Comamonas suwonensis TaxID=2606214 RepID=A0A843B6G9_9BURK|nr:neutral zinc metallopeptidase [Comamonas suwonensis]MBI1626303.1 neutral zinc metallopeptidase [Comamonas suwonensis]
MKWEGNRESDNVEDRRGDGGGRGGGGFPIGGRSIGIGTVVLALVGWGVFGINPLTTIGILSGDGSPQVQQQAPAQRPAADDQGAKFVSTVLASTEDVWSQVFRDGGANYQSPRLVLFTGVTRTACGTGQSAMGPFYCPGDSKVYLDMDFFNTMSRQLGAPGEFARAYVIAHEVGHHVQNLLGISGKVDAMRGRVSEREQNAMSVRLELQADCLAGIWANKSQQAKSWLEQGDIESAMNAAQQIGDDKLQREATGTVRPDSFTHGSSAQRVRWFTQGYKTGSVKACDTFAAQSL